MKLKKKYQLLLLTVIGSVPLSVVVISVIVTIIYNHFSNDVQTQFYESKAYPIMLGLFIVSFFALAILFSKSINTLIKRINVLNKTIMELASDDKKRLQKIPYARNDELGDLTNAVNLLIDRTISKEIEIQQQKRMKQELLTQLRHDINTPLTAMRLQLYTIERDFSQHQDIFNSLNEQINYISKLSNEYDFERLSRVDNSYVIMEKVDVLKLLNTIIFKWNFLYKVNQISIVLNDYATNCQWRSNEIWLHRLFDNIFQNTLRHAACDTLEITLQKNLIIFKDNGIGFNVEEKGTGLRIIEDICRVLDLQSTIQSNEKGTQVTISYAQY
ncbi:histidine kinase dimerization/phospho-acceptor domain-containing protein [Lysinibacillus sphaericus]|uniref:sensor histidine kinase n=1 Tax=Lysinibacillus sphaericus TaxID=1421 RepID=UPI003D7F7C25